MYSKQTKRTSIPLISPKLSDNTPISGSIKAPPATPMIINPDISLVCSGICFIANEKIIEKIFAQEKPTIKIETKIIHRPENDNIII